MTEIYKGPIEEVKLMEKVNLTEYQAKAIETFLEDNGNDKVHLIDWFNASKVPYTVDREYQPLMELKASMLATALFIGYEVEETFKSGDKVLFQLGKHQPSIVTLNHKNHTQYHKNWTTEEGCGYIAEEDFRHATPEEIYWLETLGREKVGDFRVGDILVGKDHVPFVVVSERTDTEIGYINKDVATMMVKRKGFTGLLPAESYKRFPKEQSNER